jgi:uncharacterized membrane protein (UPF0127 family)
VVRPLLLLLALALVGCTSETTSQPAGSRVVFADGAATLHVEVADDPLERSQGLMGVESLPEDEGMAFVWGTIDDGAFWMKDTLIPLSIAFVGDDDRIHTILEMEPCGTEPCRTYEAREPYWLAIEANAGWFEANGIEVGDTADLERADG